MTNRSSTCAFQLNRFRRRQYLPVTCGTDMFAQTEVSHGSSNIIESNSETRVRFLAQALNDQAAQERH